MRKWIATMLASLSLVLVMSACNNGGEPAATETPEPTAETPAADPQPAAEEPKEPPVELTWYYIVYEMPTDLQAVNDAVNEYILPKINATVKLMPIVESAYGQKMNTMLAAGEEFDLAWTARWGGGDYNNRVLKGAFLDLDELLEKTPKLKAAMPELAWTDTMVAGKIWAVPNYQIAAKAEGFIIQKRFLDKYNFDVSTIKTQDDIEPFLKLIKDNEPSVIPIAGTTNMFDYGKLWGFARDGFRVDDPTYTIVNTTEQPEYKAFLERQRRWYEAGYVYPDDATLTTLPDLRRTGNVAVGWDTTMKPGGEVENFDDWGNNEVVYVRVSEPEFTGVLDTMTAINRKSKNPEKALQLLELVNTEPELMNLLSYGIEGKHYNKVGDNFIKKIDKSGYSAEIWVMGNSLISYLLEGQAPDTWEKTHELNMTAKRPPVHGFKFNQDPVKTEVANLTAVGDEFAKALQSGSVDPNEYLPKYIEAQKNAGVDTLIAEKQKQLDEWLKQQGLK